MKLTCQRIKRGILHTMCSEPIVDRTTEGNKRRSVCAVNHVMTEVKCCGEWLLCDAFTNTCECGADYNMSGDRLADRSQWGEETGESGHFGGSREDY